LPILNCHHLLLPIADKLAFRKIRKVLGGKVHTIIVGGAPFDEQLCQFYLNVGVPVYQGYGLTEASPVISTNYLYNNKPGTVGKAFPDVEVKISDEGEILARGPNVMRGYHKASKDTEVSIDNKGWLHTGDLGTLDEHGFLTVIGRKKEIFKTSGGKMVSPVPIEKALALEPLFDYGVVVAHARKYPSCLLFPNMAYVSDLKSKRQQEELDDDDFFDTAFMKKEVSAVIDRINSNLNEWEKIRAWRVVCEKLTVEGGELMPTLSVNRPVVGQKYSQIIETMY
jgi:long-chain acyl-CoA synthetase